MTLEWRLLFSLLEHQEQRKRQSVVGKGFGSSVEPGVGAADGPAVDAAVGTGAGDAVGARIKTGGEAVGIK